MSIYLRFVSTYAPDNFCGISKYTQNLVDGMQNFGELGKYQVSAIQKDSKLRYRAPADITLRHGDPESWRLGTDDAIVRANQSGFPIKAVWGEHEFGLGRTDEKFYGGSEYDLYPGVLQRFKDEGFVAVATLHTLKTQPDNDNQVRAIQNLAKSSHALVLHTPDCDDILRKPPYSIGKETIIKYIPHGIRERLYKELDRHEIKQRMGIGDKKLLISLGLQGKNKGTEEAVKAWKYFLDEGCSKSQKKDFVFFRGGGFHDDFKGTQEYEGYIQGRDEVIRSSGLDYQYIDKIEDADWSKELIICNEFLDEAVLEDLYGASNGMIQLVTDDQQICSGIFSDNLGAGRVAVTTKYPYAVSLCKLKEHKETGLLGRGDDNLGGLFVDFDEAGIEQAAEALHYMFMTDDGKRITRIWEGLNYSRGHAMNWYNCGWQHLQFIDLLHRLNNIETGRGISHINEVGNRFNQDFN